MSKAMLSLLERAGRLVRRWALPSLLDGADLVFDFLGYERAKSALADTTTENWPEPLLAAVAALPAEGALEPLRDDVVRTLRAILCQDASGWKVAVQGLLRHFPRSDAWSALASAAKQLRPKPAPPIVVARAEPDEGEAEAIARARAPGRGAQPAGMTAAVDAVVAVSEEAPAAEEVEVIVLRRPGDPPVMPPGSKTYGSVEEWDPYERYQR